MNPVIDRYSMYLEVDNENTKNSKENDNKENIDIKVINTIQQNKNEIKDNKKGGVTGNEVRSPYKLSFSVLN